MACSTNALQKTRVRVPQAVLLLVWKSLFTSPIRGQEGFALSRGLGWSPTQTIQRRNFYTDTSDAVGPKKSRVRIRSSESVVVLKNRDLFANAGSRGDSLWRGVASHPTKPSNCVSPTQIGLTQLKRETLRYQNVVGAVREPPTPEHGPFSYRTA